MLTRFHRSRTHDGELLPREMEQVPVLPRHFLFASGSLYHRLDSLDLLGLPDHHEGPETRRRDSKHPGPEQREERLACK